MKADGYKNIEKLLERFFDGETTNAEEQELFAFFAAPDLPEHLKAYRPVFGYFETGIAKEVEEKLTLSKPLRKSPVLKRWLLTGAAVAASLLCFLLLDRVIGVNEESFNPYAGSYIIRNGVKTEIPEEVARELDRVIREAEREHLEKERMAMHPLWQYEEILTKEEEVDRFERNMEILERK